ncbi:MAG: peptidyl-prolyl cis-trans isomerase [Flavobacteriales bacterium]|nr:peptidyl-prolyl cis-trans isomerase [Flavobacteriales bacterium]
MKRKILLILIIAFSIKFDAQAQVLLNVAGEDISLNEFLAIYNKNNNNAQAIDPKTKEEYLELFVNFKLKVREARELGMDTVESFKKELAGYRRQLAAPYLTDEKVTDELIEEAYKRMQEDVDASHILIRIPAVPTPADTLKAWKKVNSLKSKIKNPAKDFENLAKENSEDPTASENGGSLGYFSAFQMVYPFETAAYTTPIGQVSDIVRTSYGYHLVYVKDRRPARGEIHVAHIMVQLEPTDSGKVLLDKEQKANEIYGKLLAGEDFAELAKQFSDDRGSAANGGDLPWFGTGRMVEEFENAAFELQKDGDFSKPIKTRYGWHIIKRLEKKGIPPFEEVKGDLEKKVSRDTRARMSKEAFFSRIKREYGFVEYPKNVKAMEKTLDSNYFIGQWKAKTAADKMRKPVFVLDATSIGGSKKEFTQFDFAEFMQANGRFQRRPPQDHSIIVSALYEEYVTQELTKFEDGLLEMKYPEFKALMTEYHDGILLFDLMDKKVWSKAVKDTTGIQEFYESTKNERMWPERVEAFIFTCENESVANSTKKYVKKKAKKKQLSKDDVLKTINVDSQLSLSIEKGKFAKGAKPILDKKPWEVGFTEFESEGAKVKFAYIQQLLPAQPKELSEARGAVISSYQDYLEKQWLEELKAKYEVKVNLDVLK